MSHHNPRHPHRHHVRPKKAPIEVEPPYNDYKGLFWLIVLGLVAVIGLGYCLSQPPLPPAPSVTDILEPQAPTPGPVPQVLPPEERTAPAPEPVKAPKAEEPKKRHKADDDEPRRHNRHRHRD